MVDAVVPASEVRKKLASLTDWVFKVDKISRTFIFIDFRKAIVFVRHVAVAAEKAKHHPDINIRYNKVKIVLSTHSAGGITSKDIDLARKLDSLSKSTTVRD